MPVWGWVILAVLLLGGRKVATQSSTGAQNGPGVNQNNLVTSLLNALTRGQQGSGGGRSSGGAGGGPGTSGASHGDPNAGQQTGGDAGAVDSGDGLSGLLSAYPPGTTLGDVFAQQNDNANGENFTQWLSDQTGIDLGPGPQTTVSDITGAQLDLIPTDSTSADTGSTSDPFSIATGQGDTNSTDPGSVDSSSTDYTGGDYTNDGGDVATVNDGGGGPGFPADGGGSLDDSGF